MAEKKAGKIDRKSGFSGWLIKAEARFASVSRVMAVIAAGVLAVMMLITVADVIGRAFMHPVKGAWELIGLLLTCAATWGLAYCQIQRSHIRITILLDRFSPRVQAVYSCLAYLLGIIGFSLICWQMFLRGWNYIFLPAGGLSETLRIPYSPFMFMLAIGAGFLAIQLIFDMVHSIEEVVKK